MRALITLCVAAVLAGGCWSLLTMTVTPLRMGSDKEVCIIGSADDESDFLEAYRSALKRKGYASRIVPAGSAFDVCPITTTYSTVTYKGLTRFLRDARIEVY